MKRVQEKIKDLVDIRSYETVKNYQNDYHTIVAAYRFTDATAELMAKWIDEIVELGARASGGGTARALAGSRGVGKSHFLAVVGALAQHTDLRTRITDSHVGMSAQRLPRQKHFVVTVERGLRQTLEEELQIALDKAFGGAGVLWGANAVQMLAIAASRAGNLPLIVIVDSAAERRARVKREDGAILGEMAEFARQNRVFLGIALDDDIAGADGVNAAIARTCAIDFLDQEHLYRIVDAFLFPKRSTARLVLRDLYQDLREAAVGFNWSEPRFAALYPVHPIVVDIAPAIRLYAPKFAFLSFAAENASKLINRPAHSLLALDEVFDRVEPELRKAAELEKTFALYDDLANNAIQQIPIMQRLQAKLILKGLLLLSLDGRGATAREIGAAMLIYDENNPFAAVSRIEDTIKLFVAASNNQLAETPDNGETRYLLGSNASAAFENRIASAIAAVNQDVIGRILRRAAQKRFNDLTFNANDDANSIEMSLKWRGGIRRGRVVWLWENVAAAKTFDNAADFDWQVFVVAPETSLDLPESETPTLVWQPATLRADEAEIVRRFAVLSTDANLIEEFGETALVAEQTTAAHVERIWSRVFLEHGKFFAAHDEAFFPREARHANLLAETLETVFKSPFERAFPAHPAFGGLLTEAEVSQIVADVFASINAAQPAAQMLAETFAAPLKLVAQRSANWVLQSDEQLLRLPLLQKILEQTAAANGKPVSLRELRRALKNDANGLSLEALHLNLAALVARRRLEFVTTTNDRITHRSLDLKIAWHEIAGAAQPLVQPRAAGELAQWANLLTETVAFKPSFANLDDANERAEIFHALQIWLADWRSKQILERFDALPDEVLNVRAWRAAASVRRNFEEIAEAVEAMLDKKSSLEETLERAIDVFGNNPAHLLENRRLLGELETFVENADLRRTIWRYAARAEPTADLIVEALRKDLLSQLLRPETSFDAAAASDLAENWNEFHTLYTNFYQQRHDAAMLSDDARQAFEQIEQSVEWQEFAGLSKLPFAPAHHVEAVEKLRMQVNTAKCAADAAIVLQTEPVCACSFRLRDAARQSQISQELLPAVNAARAALRRTLTVLAAPLSAALNEIANRENDPNFAARAQSLADALRQNRELPVLSNSDVRLLAAASSQMQQPTVRVRAPRGIAAQPLDELRQRFNIWLDNLPKAPVLVKILEE